MGFIHETGSDILGVETRSESAYLADCGDRATHKQLFIPFLRPDSIRDEIVNAIMKQAGDAFAKNDEKKAKELKSAAELVKAVQVRQPSDPRSFEAAYPWIAALVDFCTTNASMIGHLAPFRANTEEKHDDG